jgi:hypothetical protein
MYKEGTISPQKAAPSAAEITQKISSKVVKLNNSFI